MTVVYKLVAYDKETERVALEIDLSDEVCVRLRKFLGSPTDCGSIPLTAALIDRFALELLAADVKPSRFDWFFEPFAPERIRRHEEPLAGAAVDVRR